MRSLVVGTLMVGAMTAVTACAQPASDDDACEMLFVQSAAGMTFDGSSLTLLGADPNIIFFCDRPVRTAGHMTRDAWMALVSEGENTFASNHPNAAISIFGPEGDVTEVVVELSDRPVVSGEEFIFPVSVLEGTLPEVGDAVAMFIDPIGRPASPTSRAGVHRRHRRRAVRH